MGVREKNDGCIFGGVKMREIDEYLNILYKRLNLSDKETAELKAEMQNHLLDSVRELKEEGKSDQESVKIAIERFGDPFGIGGELPGILMVSRKRFKKLILIISIIIILLIICTSVVYVDNMKTNKRLEAADLDKRAAIEELQQVKLNKDYRDVFVQFSKLAAVYDHSDSLSKDLKAKHNIEIIDKIGQMNRTFKYHNTVLIAVAIIASDTKFECTLFKDITELAVMKLSDSAFILDLAQKARDADTDEEIQELSKEIKKAKEKADFKTFEEAEKYNSTLQ